jgi:hypothetical protein
MSGGEDINLMLKLDQSVPEPITSQLVELRGLYDTCDESVVLLDVMERVPQHTEHTEDTREDTRATSSLLHSNPVHDGIAPKDGNPPPPSLVEKIFDELSSTGKSRPFCEIKPNWIILLLVLLIKTLLGVIFVLALLLLEQYDCVIMEFTSHFSEGGVNFTINQSMCISASNIKNSYTRVNIDITVGIILAYQTVNLFLGKCFRVLHHDGASTHCRPISDLISFVSSLISTIFIANIYVDGKIEKAIPYLSIIMVFVELCFIILQLSACSSLKCCPNLIRKKYRGKFYICAEVVVAQLEFLLTNIMFMMIFFFDHDSFSLLIFVIALLVFWLSFDYSMIRLQREAPEIGANVSTHCECDRYSVCGGLASGILLSKYVGFLIAVITIGSTRFESSLIPRLVCVSLLGAASLMQVLSYACHFGCSLRRKTPETEGL